ncbi:MAG: dihydroorotase [Actinomycetota bacterium]
MQADTVIRNASVVTPGGLVRGGVAVAGGRIVAIAVDDLLPEAAETIDGGGRFLIPGLVDPHAHPGGKYPIDQDFLTETPGAAAGGVTTVGAIVRVPRMGQPFKEIPDPVDVISWLDAFPLGKEVSEQNSLVDFFFTFTMNSMQHVEEIERCAAEVGVTSFKFHGNLKQPATNPVSPRWAARIGLPNPFDDSMFYVGFENIGHLAGSSARAMVHCENVELAPVFQRRLSEGGVTGIQAWARRSPDFAEAEHVRRYGYLAKVTRSPFYVLHLSSKEGLDSCMRVKDENPDTVVETCPHYLTLTAEDDYPGLLGKVNPPIRWREDVEALWEGIATDAISAIGTDHVVSSRHEKLVKGDTSDHDTDPASDIWATGSGFTGLHTELPVMMTEGVRKGRITIDRLVEVCSTTPARVSGLFPRKGVIQVGSDADLVLVGTDASRTVRAEDLLTSCDFSVFEGRELTGWPTMTMLRGQIIYREGEIVAKPGVGRYLARTA